MNPRIIAARAAGLRAAMEPAEPRKVPAAFQDAADAWLEAYDSLSVSMLNQRFGVIDAPDAPERKPRKKPVKAGSPSPAKLQPHRKLSMMPVLEDALAAAE